MTRRVALVLVLLMGLASAASATTPTGLTATHRGGQTFVTFTEAGCAMGTYSVWRHTAQIASLSGLTAIATLDQDSGRLLFDDNPSITFGTGQNLTTGFVITDGGSHLAADQGLLVWTTAVTGSFYYAVTSSCDSTLVVGTNSLTSAVSETYQAEHGAVLVSTDTDYGGSGRTVKHYYIWDDYATWDTADWGYYGHAFAVLLPSSGSNPHRMVLYLHAAGCGYQEPLISVSSWPTDAVVLAPRDMCFGNGGTPTTDPYSGVTGGGGGSKFTGLTNLSTGVFQTAMESRIVLFTKLVRDNGIGDGENFHVDSNRIYIYGENLGSNGMHIAAHYNNIYAAVAASTGMVNDNMYQAFPNNTTVHVGDGSGPTIYQYRDLAHQATLRRLTPTIHTPNINNTFVNSGDYPETTVVLETYHQPYAIQWKAGNLLAFVMSTDYPQWDFFRFRLNEAYPAFSHAANSDTPEGTAPWMGSSTADPLGQRNGLLNWDSEDYDLGGSDADIVDQPDTFKITLESTASDTTSDVTIWNTQAFRPSVGASVAWVNHAGETGAGATLGSGSVTVGSLGEVTVTAMDITAAGNRLTLSLVAPDKRRIRSRAP